MGRESNGKAVVRPVTPIVVSGNVFAERHFAQGLTPGEFVVGHNNMANGPTPGCHDLGDQGVASGRAMRWKPWVTSNRRVISQRMGKTET